MKHRQQTQTTIEMLKAEISMGFPEEHCDEIGPSTHREIAVQRNEAFEDIHYRLIDDKDAVMREARHSNNVSCLRPNANSDYFGNTDIDERSNMRLKNETKITKVRNTMAPATSNSTNSLGLNVHSSSHRVGMPGSGLMAPSKTPTLYETKKRSQPFLNSDQQRNLHIYRQNDSSNNSC